jgi:hypothetical protein
MLSGQMERILHSQLVLAMLESEQFQADHIITPSNTEEISHIILNLLTCKSSSQFKVKIEIAKSQRLTNLGLLEDSLEKMFHSHQI